MRPRSRLLGYWPTAAARLATNFALGVKPTLFSVVVTVKARIRTRCSNLSLNSVGAVFLLTR
jgi:hypothetical protein